MVIYLVSSIAHQGTGYEHGLEEGGARHLLVSFLDSTGKHQKIWPRKLVKPRIAATRQQVNKPLSITESQP